MKKQKRIVGILLSLLLFATAVSSCSKNPDTSNGGDDIIVSSKNYTEALVLGHIFASMLEHNTDLNVIRKMNLGGTSVAFSALLNDEIDLYPEYTGTGYITILNKSGETDPDKVFNIVKEEYEKQYNITWLTPLGFNNTYAMAVRPETAQKYNLKTCSDLSNVSNELILGSTFEFTERQDGYLGMQKVYNMHFKEAKSVDGALRYYAIDNKNSDVIDAFTTESLLKTFGLVVLEDDKHFFPPYYAAPIIRTEVLKKHPEVGEVLNKLGGIIDEQTMIDLNYKVDKLGEDPAKVAENFLKEQGLIQ